MDAKISEKLLPKKSVKNIVLIARLQAEKSIKNKSKFHQKSLTQACDSLSFNDKIWQVWVRDFLWTFVLFFVKLFALKRALKRVFLMDFLDNNFFEILASI